MPTEFDEPVLKSIVPRKTFFLERAGRVDLALGVFAVVVDDDVDVDRLAAAAEIADLRRIMAAVADKLRVIVRIQVAPAHEDLRHVHAGAGRTVGVRFGVEQRAVLRTEHLHKAKRRGIVELERRFYGEAALRIEHHIHRCLHTGGHFDRNVLAAEAGRTGQVDVQRLRLIFRCNCI